MLFFFIIIAISCCKYFNTPDLLIYLSYRSVRTTQFIVYFFRNQFLKETDFWELLN